MSRQKQALKTQQHLWRLESELTAVKAEAAAAQSRLQREADDCKQGLLQEADKHEASRKKLEKQVDDIQAMYQAREGDLTDAKDAVKVNHSAILRSSKIAKV